LENINRGIYMGYEVRYSKDKAPKVGIGANAINFLV